MTKSKEARNYLPSFDGCTEGSWKSSEELLAAKRSALHTMNYEMIATSKSGFQHSPAHHALLHLRALSHALMLLPFFLKMLLLTHVSPELTIPVPF